MKGGVLTTEILEPYAQALMAIAQSNNVVDQIGGDVAGLLELLHSSPELNQFLASPVVRLESKKAVLQQTLGDRVHPFTRSFLMILVDRRRIFFLEGICKKFQDLLRQLNQTVLAEVTSAVSLSETQQQTIRERVMAMMGAQQVELDTKLDSDLIGGVIIKVGSQVIDASLRGQLRRISLRLNSAP